MLHGSFIWVQTCLCESLYFALEPRVLWQTAFQKCKTLVFTEAKGLTCPTRFTISSLRSHVVPRLLLAFACSSNKWWCTHAPYSHMLIHAHVNIMKLLTVLTCSSCRLFLTAVLLILRRAGSSICSSSAATALTARDLSTSMLELRLDVAAVVPAGAAA